MSTIRKVDIRTEVRRAYLDYAMSVIVARALPDVRDGLKPVQRRILYAMYDMGLRPGAAYKKSARIVGEVLGKYHPHGDAAVYEAMARMAQPFSMRVPLVDGQGNFGSIDGDAPAAMRYTEARLAPAAMELLRDIEKGTVDWRDNFDGSLQEPSVLPARLPNLLINGASGIAVGMSTNIPPHNPGEVIDALVYMLERWETIDEVDTDDLMRFIRGPDFPTGGIVYRRESRDGEDALRRAYARRRGRVTVRARVHLEPAPRGRQQWVITEIPYQVNKRALLESIARGARTGKLPGIADLRDESDRHGMRIVVELAAGADPEETLEALYTRTALESRYSIILLALVNGEPRTLTLKQMLQYFLEHRLDVLIRRVNYDLTRARHRAHIVEGLLIALSNLDAVIETIRRSRRVETARRNLQRRFKLTEVQAQAILDMPLRQLAALERRKLKDEHVALRRTIADLESLLASPKRQRDVIREELLALKSQYATPRRTEIGDVRGERPSAQAVWVTVSRTGRMARRLDGTQPPPRATAQVVEPPLALALTSTRELLHLFTETGQSVALPVQQLPEGVAWAAEGMVWTTLAHVQAKSKLAAILPLPLAPSRGSLLLITARGKVKRLSATLLPSGGRALTPVMRLEEGDRLVTALWVGEGDEVIVGTALGQAIRFAVDEVRLSGLRAGGVSGIRLAEDDRVIGAAVAPQSSFVVTVSERGAVKRTSVDEYPAQRRGGKGVQAAKLSEGEHLIALGGIDAKGRCILVTRRGAAKTLSARTIPVQGRATRGTTAIALRGRDRVVHVVFPIHLNFEHTNGS